MLVLSPVVSLPLCAGLVMPLKSQLEPGWQLACSGHYSIDLGFQARVFRGWCKGIGERKTAGNGESRWRPISVPCLTPCLPLKVHRWLAILLIESAERQSKAFDPLLEWQPAVKGERVSAIISESGGGTTTDLRQSMNGKKRRVKDGEASGT